jgi:SAM-dependent methyltransferase
LGENLVAVARRNLAAYPQVEVCTGAFEDWQVELSAFDLVISATAFHWIDPAISYRKAAQALKPDGVIGLFWTLHVQRVEKEGFFEAVHEVYQREAPELARDDDSLRPINEVQNTSKEIEKTGLFGEVAIRQYRWDVTYDAADYIRLVNTYSDYRSLDRAVRKRLYQGIADLIDTRFGGSITKNYLTVLYVAHRK